MNGKMLYDLNIAWTPHTSAADLERTLRFSASLGYDVVALNHTIGAPLPPQATNPIPKFDDSSSSSPSTSTSTSTPASAPKPRLPTVLRRATVVLSEPSQHHRLPQLAAAYDILAVRPQTEESFSAACLSLADASLISLDLTARQPFAFRPKPCMSAVGRGVRFEVCYSQVLQGPAPASATHTSGGGQAAAAPVDARARATFIGNVASLVRATRGRGIVVSSEARSALGLRAPADVVNLLHVWGLSADRAAEGLGLLPRGVVVNEGLRRSGFRGVVDVVGVADRERPDVEMAEAGDDGGGGGGGGATTKAAPGTAQGGTKGGRGGGREANNPGGKKRKNGDATAASTTAAPNAGEGAKPAADGEDQPMSKRQAKRMKAALRKKQAGEEGTTGS
ncbi:putative RNase P subunit p30 [Rosellinia necatrix]|uniref:Putative RNase P subunit p30 n=1 Tax=Rosellinia necatrix TaxID=77044 RepID=A0A1W2TUB5_ROSNE|nr:putative RNase P subunit p30 [Rosellinia necatrix]